MISTTITAFPSISCTAMFGVILGSQLSKMAFVKLITGSICGVKVETIEDPLMQEIRYLDKLVDELAKGKAMEKVLRK